MTSPVCSTVISKFLTNPSTAPVSLKSPESSLLSDLSERLPLPSPLPVFVTVTSMFSSPAAFAAAASEAVFSLKFSSTGAFTSSSLRAASFSPALVKFRSASLNSSALKPVSLSVSAIKSFSSLNTSSIPLSTSISEISLEPLSISISCATLFLSVRSPILSPMESKASFNSSGVMLRICAAPAIISLAVSGAASCLSVICFFSCFEKAFAFVLSGVLTSLRVEGFAVFTPSSGLTL